MNPQGMTLEQELQVRSDAVEFFLKLIDEFRKTGEFFLQKVQAVTWNDMYDFNALLRLMEFMKLEAWNIAEHAGKVKMMQDTCLLCMTKKDPYEELRLVLPQIGQLNFYDPNIKSGFDAFLKVANSMAIQVFAAQNAHIFVDEKREAKFNEMLERYKKEHPRALACYLEDVYDASEAKSSLRNEYKDSVGVECWNKCGRIIVKTIDAMRGRQCTESELLPLIEYVAKYEMLSAKPKRKRKGNFSINNSQVTIQKAEDVIAEGGTKIVNNNYKE